MPGAVKAPGVRRVIDANYNRAKEALRVCEDVCRFVRDDRRGSARFKKIRHDLTAAVAVLGLNDLLAARDIARDVGRATIAAEASRAGVEDIFYANAQRAKESLRVLEEFAKLVDAGASGDIKRLRYAFYDEERRVLAPDRPRVRRQHS